MRTPLERALTEVGSMQAMAELLGVTKGAVGQWKLPGRRIPAEHCPVIERATKGLVKCEEMRPDVDWAYLRTGERRSEALNRRHDDPKVAA
jgi:DNA-binding transcriptional regulator YdaS (Cro superfamily)